MINIALLGFGTVGSGVAELISTNSRHIIDNVGDTINIKYILDIRDFKGHPLESKFTKNYDDIINDAEVSIVAEMIGGTNPAYDFTVRALKAKKSVVTSNKELVAKHGVELLSLAKENGVSYLFEASVGGGIPIIRPMENSLVGDEILKIDGILNGTTNYILTQMFDYGKGFDEALKEAQSLGYAEADPTADVEGIDVCRKICILTAIAFGAHVNAECIPTKGISKISLSDIKDGEKLGASVKLIAHAEKINGKALISVEPRLVSKTNPLSTIRDVFNGILLDTNGAGQLMFFGRGAGKLPTASAVLSDIIEIVKNNKSENKKANHSVWTDVERDFLVPETEEKADRYIRVKGNRLPDCAKPVTKEDDTVSFVIENINGNETQLILRDYEVLSSLKILH